MVFIFSACNLLVIYMIVTTFLIYLNWRGQLALLFNIWDLKLYCKLSLLKPMVISKHFCLIYIFFQFKVYYIGQEVLFCNKFVTLIFFYFDSIKVNVFGSPCFNTNLNSCKFPWVLSLNLIFFLKYSGRDTYDFIRYVPLIYMDMSQNKLQTLKTYTSLVTAQIINFLYIINAQALFTNISL